MEYLAAVAQRQARLGETRVKGCVPVPPDDPHRHADASGRSDGADIGSARYQFSIAVSAPGCAQAVRSARSPRSRRSPAARSPSSRRAARRSWPRAASTQAAAGSWKKPTYQLRNAWEGFRKRMRPHGRRVWAVQHHRPLNPFRVPCREMPRQDRSPVVPHHCEALSAERVGQPEHVVGEGVDAIGPNARGACRTGCSPAGQEQRRAARPRRVARSAAASPTRIPGSHGVDDEWTIPRPGGDGVQIDSVGPKSQELRTGTASVSVIATLPRPSAAASPIPSCGSRTVRERDARLPDEPSWAGQETDVRTTARAPAHVLSRQVIAGSLLTTSPRHRGGRGVVADVHGDA